MGEVANAMINGELCQWCGVYIGSNDAWAHEEVDTQGRPYLVINSPLEDDDLPGFPRMCTSCTRNCYDTHFARVQDLKMAPQYVRPVINRSKPFEVRVNDRDYAERDLLMMWEWAWHRYASKRYSGDWILARVTYCHHIQMASGDCKSTDAVVLGIQLVDNGVNQANVNDAEDHGIVRAEAIGRIGRIDRQETTEGANESKD